MNHTKTQFFAAFKHVEDKNTYWINGAWCYDQESPGLFEYETKEQKQRVKDVGQSLLETWNLKDVEMVVLKIQDVTKLTVEEDVGKKRRGRKPKNKDVA